MDPSSKRGRRYLDFGVIQKFKKENIFLILATTRHAMRNNGPPSSCGSQTDSDFTFAVPIAGAPNKRKPAVSPLLFVIVVVGSVDLSILLSPLSAVGVAFFGVQPGDSYIYSQDDPQQQPFQQPKISPVAPPPHI
jgi:hypothetical protein